MENKKIYIVGGSIGYANWILSLGVGLANNLKEADLVMFTGGSDVDPIYYGHPKYKRTYSDLTRDAKEFLVLGTALAQNKKLIGICRGAQLLCAGSGGKLVQDMNHPNSHEIKTIDNNILTVTSTHHQMMYPFEMPKEDYLVIGEAEKQLCNNYHYNNTKIKKVESDPEIVFFKKTNALAIQSHPEFQFLYGEEQHQTVLYLQNLLVDFMEDKGMFSKECADLSFKTSVPHIEPETCVLYIRKVEK